MMQALHRRYGRAAESEREQRYIAKCRACGVVTSGLTSGQNMHRDKGDPQRTGDVYTYYPAKEQRMPWPAPPGGLVLDCRQCGQPRHAVQVRGKYNPNIKCNARCMSSTGTTCECSCGGKNHGGAYSS